MKYKLRLMIIDDEPIVGKRLKRLLEKDGFNVETFTRGSLATEELAKDRYDIVITDLKMGKVDGMQILETALTANPDVKVIIISGFSKVEIFNEAFRKGAFAFIIKPFKIDELKKILSEAVIQIKSKYQTN
ncbi:MAG: response regulator [Nitrospirota bacterium]|nr:response regulator [Nitrospirota bacterium]